MKSVIQISCLKHPAAVIDHDPQSNQGRFEWLPSFRDSFPLFVNAFTRSDNKRASFFDAETSLPAVLKEYLPTPYPERILNLLFQDAKTGNSAHRSALAWLSLMGNRGMGSFRFDPYGLPELDTTEVVDLDNILASLIQINNGQPLGTKLRRELLRCSLFTRGKSPKALLCINDFTGEVHSGQTEIAKGFNGWVLKWDGVELQSSKKLQEEYERYQMALECGIQVTECRRLKEAELNHLIIKRFDRDPRTETWVIPFTAWIEEDYDGWNGVFRRMRVLRMSYQDTEQMFRRLIFSTYLQNGCADPKKICFTFSDKQGWGLAPAFNLKAEYPADSGIRFLDEKRTLPDNRNLTDFGKHLNIRKTKALIQEMDAILTKYRQDQSNKATSHS
jgi:serine/threonine-protein kinase HipA